MRREDIHHGEHGGPRSGRGLTRRAAEGRGEERSVVLSDPLCQAQDVLLDGCHDARAGVGIDVDVDFQAHAEVIEVEAGLDGEADTGEEVAGVVGLGVVDVDAEAMDLGAP